jgi:hypothetical protein
MDLAGLQRLDDRFGVLDEALPRLVHPRAETLELRAGEPATDAEDRASLGHVIEHRELLRHPHGVVPRQHHHHRSQLHPPGSRGDPGQELGDVGIHDVVAEVVLRSPDRIESERLGHVGQGEFVRVHIGITARIAQVLEEQSHSYVHEAVSLISAGAQLGADRTLPAKRSRLPALRGDHGALRLTSKPYAASRSSSSRRSLASEIRRAPSSLRTFAT